MVSLGLSKAANRPCKLERFCLIKSFMVSAIFANFNSYLLHPSPFLHLCWLLLSVMKSSLHDVQA